jgi:hypothetical protein
MLLHTVAAHALSPLQLVPHIGNGADLTLLAVLPPVAAELGGQHEGVRRAVPAHNQPCTHTTHLTGISQLAPAAHRKLCSGVGGAEWQTGNRRWSKRSDPHRAGSPLHRASAKAQHTHTHNSGLCKRHTGPSTAPHSAARTTASLLAPCDSHNQVTSPAADTSGCISCSQVWLGSSASKSRCSFCRCSAVRCWSDVPSSCAPAFRVYHLVRASRSSVLSSWA